MQTRNTNPKCRTYVSEGPILLSRFITRSGSTVAKCAKEIDVGVRTLQRWLNSQARPHLAAAVLIDVWTSGSVPVASWMTEKELARRRRML